MGNPNTVDKEITYTAKQKSIAQQRVSKIKDNHKSIKVDISSMDTLLMSGNIKTIAEKEFIRKIH